MTSRSSVRVRLDELLVQRGHTSSREKARALVLAGRVSAPGLPFLKPGQRVPEDLQIDVTPAPSFVGRGGLKIEHALDRFGVVPSGRICADVGASTGGFTDCLLQRGARRVYAIDVGYGQLDWRLRSDPRVVVMERTNARYLERLDEPVSLVVMDVSFISIRLLLPAILRIAEPGAELVSLVKPQFEAGKGRVGKGGIVRDPAVHREVLTSLAGWLEGSGQSLLGVCASPIRGAEGNVEFLMHVRLDTTAVVADSSLGAIGGTRTPRPLERPPLPLGEGWGEGVPVGWSETVQNQIDSALAEAHSRTSNGDTPSPQPSPRGRGGHLAGGGPSALAGRS